MFTIYQLNFTHRHYYNQITLFTYWIVLNYGNNFIYHYRAKNKKIISNEHKLAKFFWHVV